MVSKPNVRPAFFKDMVDAQPQAFKNSYRNWQSDPGIFSAIDAVNMPFEAAGQYAGDKTLAATDSPAAATTAYLAGSGMFGTSPLTGIEHLGQEGLKMVHNGISFGEGPLAGLQYLAPSVIKREGGNWAPGVIENQIFRFQRPIVAMYQIG